MLSLAADPRTIFLGQSVAYPGNVIYKNLASVPTEKKIELPVFEETQMGMTLGLSMAGFVPVSIYPRFNFLLLAANQLVNHIDKIEQISGFKPHLIIKTMVGATKPLYPGVQHCSNFTDAFRQLCENIKIIELDCTDHIEWSYRTALETPGPYLIIEHGNLYAD